MKKNLPITQREYDYAADATLMSVTDTDSRITYANAAFIAVSGFEPTELIGQPHNLVRHPDMPTEAFADMWATLKSGRSWSALVKNRRKNGDHYWVRANATPVRRQGRLVGYMSVRTQPGRDEIDAAEALYRDFREGRAGSRRFHQGLVLRTGWLAWTSVGQRIPVRWRIRVALLATALLSLLAGVATGLGGPALAAVGVTNLVGLLGAGWWLERRVAQPLADVLQQALRVAEGEPGHHLALNRIDEIGMLQRAIQQAGLNLRSLIDDVSAQMGGLQTASTEIAHGNNDLSARTEQAAANLQQTAASMEQMTASVKQSADTARQAAALAGSASHTAATGGQLVGQVVGTMEAITLASRKIHDIIGVVNDIAFQTNILALNAAVEAARAGEQGRGFAVVATEVRSLAQRSATAAEEIKTLISHNVDQVETGSGQVGAAGRAMTEIVAEVQRVAHLIGQISAATLEQSNGIGQVNTAIGQLDTMTQQNAALVEQSSAAAESLKAQAGQLADAVAVFKPAVA